MSLALNNWALIHKILTLSANRASHKINLHERKVMRKRQQGTAKAQSTYASAQFPKGICSPFSR